ncbi:hypothetical protein GEV33_006900 [Tenebrio molitor]|jgi:hypothetical protein|uniref:Uncharacterized protein n=1 Tax=Tenebrio molitor TaxID=7067 RepID=A0A8J6HKX9_TENMO|nr:hypothetical protein GEV33_006900 [Tenebrio molitor]
MDNNADSPDSLASDQLTVELMSPRAKRRRIVINDIDVDRRDGTPDLTKNNNNDVGFVLMDDHHENGTEDDDEVRMLVRNWRFAEKAQVGALKFHGLR